MVVLLERGEKENLKCFPVTSMFSYHRRTYLPEIRFVLGFNFVGLHVDKIYSSFNIRIFHALSSLSIGSKLARNAKNYRYFIPIEAIWFI